MGLPRRPSFSDLPLDKSGPPGNAWGLWGKDDELGMLNIITPETVISSITEIKEGVRISLDWPLDKPSHPAFDRQRFSHEILNKAPMVMNDDAIRINTQSSTQWDGFRHYGYQRTGQFYNGHRQEEFSPEGGPLSIDLFAKKGGITGRGVLLDWYSWSIRNKKQLSPFQTGAVTLVDLQAIISEHNIVLRPADILFIRVGFTAEYEKLSAQQKQEFPNREPGGLLGLEASRDSLRWLWENQFAAIASDAAGFERGPATGPYNEPDVSIHQWCLAGWGMPIGELFDLDELAEACRERKRFTFFLQSTPLKIPGGVASPANAVAFL
jgi:kynurenine formamidase